MSEFALTHRWLAERERGVAPSTMCNLQIFVGDRNVTEYVAESTDRHADHLEIPAYYLAEWIAENWWPLLYEPRKSEDSEDNPDFLSRHSFLAAQHGFALPKVLLVAMGKSIDVTAIARDAPLADVRFKNSKHASVSHASVEIILRGFVESVVARLSENSIADTYLQDAWSLISETADDEIAFCRHVGALGLSPYDIDDEFCAFIERMVEILGDKLLNDLCLVSTARTFRPAASIAENALVLIRDASTSTLAPLNKLHAPNDNISAPAYRRGVNAARNLRTLFNIGETDPKGATKIFEILHIDTTHRAGTVQNEEQATITGAVVRDDLEMRVALLQSSETKRRFSGARAIFAAWSAETEHDSRLLTSAVTRDQQANRAFAAELTAPITLIRSRARGGRLTQQAIWDLAGELEIGADVIRKQAMNNALQAAPI